MNNLRKAIIKGMKKSGIKRVSFKKKEVKTKPQTPSEALALLMSRFPKGGL